jgi:DNA-binding MarR family transcriptional regulator
MRRIDIQKLLSINGYWTVNKHLARKFGFASTILLQQLIDLQFEYFPNGDFYQQQDELAKTLGITEKILVAARKRLVENNVLIARRGHGAKYYYTVLTDNIIELFESAQEEPSKVTKGHIRKLQNGTANSNKQEHKEIIQEELDVSSSDNENKDFYGKIFFKIVEAYPKNRIGNRQHGLKKFSTLSKEEAKLAAINLKRYLAVAGTFVKSLQNYITEQCFTEAWLKAEEQNQKQKNQKNNDTTNNAKSFTDRNVTFF